MGEKLMICICALLFGIIGSVMILSSHYSDQYTKLRREIIQKTGVDITYPENDCKMNDSIFGGRINTKTCKKIEVEYPEEEKPKISM